MYKRQILPSVSKDPNRYRESLALARWADARARELAAGQHVSRPRPEAKSVAVRG